MTCRHCHAAIGPPARYCSACGAKLGDAAVDDPLQGQDESRHAERALTAQYLWYRGLIDSLIAFVGIFDLSGQLIDANRAALDVVGLTLDELRGEPFWEIYCWAYSRDVQNQVQDALGRALAGEAVRFEAKALVRDGNFITVDAMFNPLRDSSGHIRRVIGSAVDVTERHQAEQSLKEAQLLHDELAHAARVSTLAELAPGLAHELAQPLTSLSLYVNLASELAAGSDSERLLAALRKVSDLSLQAREIVCRMRSFVRRNRSQRTKHNVNELVDDALKILAREIKASQAALARELGDVAEVVVDGIQIQQVLVNLIQNALEAMETTPVGQRVLSVTTAASNDNVLVRIADTGCGADAGDLFIPFRTTKPRGLGLGLTICRMLIEAHGGEIGFSPNPGGGAVFYFVL